MDELSAAVRDRRWARLDDGPLLIILWLQVEAHGVRVTLVPMPDAPQLLGDPWTEAQMRMLTAGVGLVEVSLDEARRAATQFDALVGLVPSPAAVLRGAPARAAVSFATATGCVEEFVLTVRGTDAMVPLWRGVTLVPVANLAFRSRGFRVDGYGPHELRPRLLCAAVRARSGLAFARHVVLPGGEIGLSFAGIGSPPLVLPDLRDAVHDRGSEQRARQRAATVQEDLARAVWDPARVARLGMLRAIDDL